MTLDHRALLARCLEGDELAWEALVRRHQGRIYGLCFHYLGNAEDARDAAQEIFVRIYERLDSCTDLDRFTPWMIRMARNACVDRLRRQKARPPSTDIPVEEVVDLPAPTPGPDETWARDRRKQLVHTAMRAMGSLNREMIVLKEMQGLSLDEISRLLGVPVGTVKSRASRARVELAQRVRSLVRGV